MLTRHQLLWAARRSMHGTGKADPQRMAVGRHVYAELDRGDPPAWRRDRGGNAHTRAECLRHLDYMVDHMHGSRPGVRDWELPSTEPIPVAQVMSDEKINRWLGFIQGALWAMGVASIDDLRDVNLTAKHRPDATQATEGCQFDGGGE